jgi:cobalt-zinc-cadmium efflux system protein
MGAGVNGMGGGSESGSGADGKRPLVLGQLRAAKAEGCGHDHDHGHAHDHDHEHGQERARGRARDRDGDHGDAHAAPLRKSAAGHHHHHHGHHHHGHHHGGSIKNLKIALALNFGFSLVEIAGGIWTGSVAAMADAVHDFGDAMAIALALVLEKLAGRRGNARWSYGYRRLSLLSALVTAALLLVASAFIVAQAIPRLFQPQQPKVGGMIAMALLGIAVNGFAALKLLRGKTMNERVVSWHLLEDVFGWVTVLVGALVMSLVDAPIIDPILSIIFSLFIVWNVLRTMRETAGLFLQASPQGVDMKALRSRLAVLPGVVSTHDAHLWSLDGESHVLTLHVVVRDGTTVAAMAALKAKIRDVAAELGRVHVTVEIESETEACPDVACVDD